MSALETLKQRLAEAEAEKRRLAALCERRQIHIDSLLESGHAVLTQRSFRDAAPLIFNACKRLVGARSGYIALLTEDGAENEVLYLDPGGLPCTVNPDLPMPIRGLRSKAYQKGACVFDNDFANSKWEALLPEGHVTLKNVMFAPLMIDGKVVGLIGLANKPGGFDAENADLAQAFAEHAAIALMNSYTLASLEHRESELKSVRMDLEKEIQQKKSDLIRISRLIRAETAERKNTEMQLRQSTALLDALSRAQSRFIADADPRPLFKDLLDEILALTKSTYGFIGDIRHTPEGKPFLKTHAITNIAWDEVTRAFYERHAPNGLEFHDLDNLFGSVITTGRHVIANTPELDPRSKGLPPGHPLLAAFLGIPLYHGSSLVGMAGMANRPEGYDEKLILFLEPFIHTCATMITAWRGEQNRKELEKRLIQREKLSALGLLVSGIAHEINNPNNFISFNLPILKDYLGRIMGVMDNQAREDPQQDFFGMGYNEFREDLFRMIENMLHGAKRISNTVAALTDFVGMKDHKPLQTINLKNVIENTIALCKGQVRAMVEDLRIRVAEDLPPLLTDAMAVEQVLMNLIINAAQAAKTREGAFIRIEAGLMPDAPENAYIRVEDNAGGIDEAILNRIFDPFFTTKPPGAGTGLGLYICHNIAENLDGRIDVASRPGKGSTFTLVLPVTAQSR